MSKPFSIYQQHSEKGYHEHQFVLWYKRLEVGVFKLPRLAPGTLSVELKASELAMLLDGIDLSKLQRTPRYQHRPTVA